VNPEEEVVMAKVQGVKEKLHGLLYDAFFVPGAKNGQDAKTFQQTMTDPRVIRFFVDVQNKTKLETNMQAAGVLPSLNTFETRALRVVVSSPSFPPFTGEVAKEPAILADLIYNSVTTLIVGEKTMFEAPTYWFPGGAGVSPGFPAVTNHGEPDPMATFRFAEPVMIEPQQNFRVEMLFPQGVPGQDNQPEPNRLAGLKGPLRVWVAMEGYLTRDVQ
jgi:hypothetical protein